MFWLRNKRINFPLRNLILRLGMRGRYTIIHYQLYLKEYSTCTVQPAVKVTNERVQVRLARVHRWVRSRSVRVHR